MRISDWSSDVCSSDLAELAAKQAPTWLDRELMEESRSVVRDAGFGREVRTGLAARRPWLIEPQLADGEGREVRMRNGELESLRPRELATGGARLSTAGRRVGYGCGRTGISRWARAS